jgi:uncharacterized protein (TIGR01619 family)
MSDDWDFYRCRLDNEPASIYLDLGITAQAPIPDMRYMAYVRVRMRTPRPDGLSSQEEYDTLIRIEDRFTATLSQGGATIYVGRNTSGGCRDFYFYRREPRDWDQRVRPAMSEFPDYVYETGSREDPQWTTYRNFLSPSGDDMQRIQNRRVCDQLQKNGDALTATREIDHWAFFPDADSRTTFITRIKTMGFDVRNAYDRDQPHSRFGVQICRTDLPSFENIDSVALP